MEDGFVMRICITTCIFILILTLHSNALNSYTVKKGDTLYDIALRHNTSVVEIKELNNLVSGKLSLGQTLKLPSTYSNYKVKKGDTLGSIAFSHGLTSSKDLMEFNNMKNSRLSIGQLIKIPSSLPDNNLNKNNPQKIQKNIPIVHTVKKKESLYSIARMHGSSVEQIKAENNLKNNNLKPGQKLTIPTVKSEVSSKAQVISFKSLSEASQKSEIKYTVKSGDTLGHIAEKHGLNSSKEIVDANNLNSTNLSLGQVLIIPSKQKAAAQIKEENTAKFTYETSNKDTDQSKPVVIKTELKQEKIQKPVKKQPEEVVTYTVKSGDTLGQIAVKHGLNSSKEIKEFNGLRNTKLSIGQEIKIPSAGAVAQSKTAEVKSDPIQITHTVKAGESLYAIARMHGSSVDKIKAENRLIANKLSIGQKLIIPQSGQEIRLVKSEEKAPVPKAKPKPVSKKKEFTGTYKVKRGDTLSQIAQKFSVSTSELKKANNLRNNNIGVGQKLSVPYTAAANSKPKKHSKPVNKTHTVKKGDTLIGIANKYGTNVAALTNYNNLNSLTLRVGDKIQIPDKSYKYTKSGNIQYRVKRGDTLSTIARNFKVTVSSIKSANGLRSSRIKAGTKLTIPTAKKNTTVVKHTVRRGDTLSSIARKHGSSVSSIKRANNLKSSYIRPGQKLKIHSTVNTYVTTVKLPNRGKVNKNLFINEFEAKNELVEVAKKYLGAPYKFGGTSTRTGIDCSAYVNKIYGYFDVNLPRTARDIYKKGHWVSKGKLQKGDLVFFTTYAKFPSHVGIYIGNNKFIHASSASKRVTITNINKNYYKKRYIGAKRIDIKNVYAKKTP